MADPYVGEIRAVGFNFAPNGWALCNGALVAIQQNTALFSLIGTNYGGDGKATFGLPNLQGASPMGAGVAGLGLTPRDLGEAGGASSVTLTPTEMPRHSHAAMAVAALGNTASPSQASWAQPRTGRAPLRSYAPTGTTALHPGALSIDGSDQPHNNMPPYLVINYIIALQGAFPPRS